MDNATAAANPHTAEDTAEVERIGRSAEPVDPFAVMSEVDPAAAAALREDWGAEFDRNIALARHAATIFADPALRAALEESRLGDDPRIVRAAADIGRMIQQRSPVRLDDQRPDDRNIEARLSALAQRDDYWSPAIQREIRQIYLKLYGDRPLPVHRGTGDAGRGAW